MVVTQVSVRPWKTVILHDVATSSKQCNLFLVLNENQMTFGNDHQCKTDPNMKFHQLNRRNKYFMKNFYPLSCRPLKIMTYLPYP